LDEKTLFARVDGDSFMVLLKNCSHDKGEVVLHESLERLSDFRFSHGGETYSVSASISMVVFAPFQYTLEELIKASSNSLKIAKQTGRNKGHIYDPSDATIRRISMEVETAKLIKEALSGGPARFELFAQDIVPLQYESTQVGYEILIRMWDREGKFIPPDNFLPTAERYQLMSDIDSFVVWNYLENVISNKAHIENLHSVHINLAGSSLNNPDFQAKVKEAVEHFDFPWEKLELEVTESSAIGSFNLANEFISWLKSRGIGLALDDFGTGMASFEYLKSMPFDIVKIDGSFVKEMHKDPADKAVIKYIHEIATLKGQETVAEYVETQEDVEALREIGITYGQGYHLGKPRSLSSWLE
jgi:EAL domain-containing protein (putative c-di-GMP-specific phosphodiesterase class I)